MTRELEKLTSRLQRITAADFDELERWMMSQPVEIEIPVSHKFAGDIYIREGTLPAGSLVLGHEHKEAHQCVILSGRMTLITPDGAAAEIIWPCEFTGQPGRKLVFVHESVTMQNIHPTGDWPERLFNNVEAMENHLYNKSAFHQSQRKGLFHARNHRFIPDVERCDRPGSLKPVTQCGMGVAIGIGALGLGLGIYGAVSNAKAQGKAQSANSKAQQQAVTQQIANLTGQVSADQASIAASTSSQKMWEYIAIGAGVLVVIGGAAYLIKRRAK